MLLRRRRKVTWTELVDELSGMVAALPIGCKEISIPDKAAIFDLMRCYTADPEDFRQCLHFSKSGYTKVLLRELPKEAGNFVLMCWAPNQMSGIHAHEGSRCFVKVLSGLLKEERYSHPANKPEGVSILGDTEQIRGTTWRENDVAYIDDSMGCHRVANQSSRQPAVTLHLYVPPYRKSRLFELDQLTNRITFECSKVVDVTFDEAGSRSVRKPKGQETEPKQEGERAKEGEPKQEAASKQAEGESESESSERID